MFGKLAQWRCSPLLLPRLILEGLTERHIEIRGSYSFCYMVCVYFVTARKRCLGQGNIFRSVCQEFCPQEGSTWAGTPPGPGRYTPQTRYTPLGPGTSPSPWDQAGTPQDQVPPEQCMLGDTGNKRAVRILLECILVLLLKLVHRSKHQLNIKIDEAVCTIVGITVRKWKQRNLCWG